MIIDLVVIAHASSVASNAYDGRINAKRVLPAENPSGVHPDWNLQVGWRFHYRAQRSACHSGAGVFAPRQRGRVM